MRSNSTALSENEFSELLKQTKTAREKLKIELEKGRDRLLELKFSWREQAQALADQIAE